MLDFKLSLKNDHVLLRPMVFEDYHAFIPLVADPDMWTYFTMDLSNPDELKKWVESAISQTQEKTRLAFTVENPLNGHLMGSTSLGNISYRDKRIEIGWTWLGNDFQGKGINDTMKYLLLKYCFEGMPFERVECKTDVLNLPARKALLRIGMQEEGVLRSHTQMIHNRRRDTIYYSVLRHEWHEIKKKNNWD